MKRKTRKLVLGCTALLAFSTLACGLVSTNESVMVNAAESPVRIVPMAAIRLATDKNDANGIRFESNVTAQYYENNTNAVYGTLICPADYLSQTNVLCHDDTENGDLYLYDKENPNTATGNKNAVLDIRAIPEYDTKSGVYVFRGSLTNIKDNNLARPFAARSYVGIPNGEGGYTYQYSEVYSRSIYSVATHVVADTETYAGYNTAQQSFLNNVTDAVASSITAMDVRMDKVGKKVSTSEEVKVTATVTVDTKHYDGELDVAPMFTVAVDGTESAEALNRVGANVYTLTDLGNYTLTPYVGKTVKTTAENISLTCNMLAIFTKAGDITTDSTGKLVNKYIASALLDWSDKTDGKLNFNNATVGSFDGYENVFTYDLVRNENLESMIVLQDALLDKISIGTWLVFDAYMEDSANDKQAQYVYRANAGNDSYLSGESVHTAYYGNTTTSFCKTYMYGFDENGNTVDSTKGIGHQWYNGWGRIAVQFTDEGFENFTFFMRTDLFSDTPDATRKMHIKNMYLTTDSAPYSVEASGFDTTKKYATGDTINLTATAYKDGVVVENTTNVFSVEGSANLNGNVLTVGKGEIKITVTNSEMNVRYPVSRTYTIQAESWSSLTITGIDESKTYGYNEIVELGATIIKEGKTEAQTVDADFEVKSGSAIVWQDNQGKWYAKPGVGNSEISATYAGEEITLIFKGDEKTIMLLGGETKQGYQTDDILNAYFKNENGSTSYTYEMYNGRYAVNYLTDVNDKNNFEIKEEYNYLADINGWLYLDIYVEENRPSVVYFSINNKEYLYIFSSSNWENVPDNENKESMQQTEWQWYDIDGTPLHGFDSNCNGRWLTLEFKLNDLSGANDMQLRLEKYPNCLQNLYVSSVIVSKERLITQKQSANEKVLHLLDDEEAFNNYWAPLNGETNSEFTWTTIGGREAVKYTSLVADCTALSFAPMYSNDAYNHILKNSDGSSTYNYLYIDYYVAENQEWNPLSVLMNFAGISPCYINKYANTVEYNKTYSTNLEYQWYIDTNNDGVLEPLSDAPTNYKGVWLTLEIVVPENIIEANADIRIEKYPDESNVNNDLYISNVRLSKDSLTGIITQ